MEIVNYNVKIELLREMLGTNPNGLDVMDKHILDRQRKLITENSEINNDVNKYLKAFTISPEKAEVELGALRKRLEEVMGQILTDEQYEALKSGDFKDIKGLLETFSELKEKGITCFFRNDEGFPAIGSHMIHGFLKASGIEQSKIAKRKNGVFLRSGNYTTTTLNQRVRISPDLITASDDVVRFENGDIKYLQRSLRAMTAQGPRVSLAKSEQLPIGTTFEFTVHVINGDANEVTKENIEDLFTYGQMFGLGQWRNASYGRFKVLSIELQ